MKVLNVVSDPVSAMLTVYEQLDGGMVVKKQVHGEYVCYLARKDTTRELLRALRGSQHVAGVVQEGEWVRISWRTRYARETACDPKQGWFLKQGIQTYEGDVAPSRRWIADSPDVHIAKPRRVYLDIETDVRVPISRKEESRILCWTLIDDDDNEITGMLDEDSDRNEKLLMQKLWRELGSFDQVLAWNGDHFDFPVIFARSKLANLAVDSRRWLWLDHLELFRRMNVSAAESGDEKQSMSLQSVSMSVLKEGKMEGFDYKQIYPAWEAGGDSRDKLLQYNIRDVQLMRAIEKKTGYVELHQTLCEATGVLPDTYGIQPMPQVEQFMLRLAKANGVHFKTRVRTFDEEQNGSGFKGAFVMEPTTRGIAYDVHVVDFSSMYPSIILSWNMSPETVREFEDEIDLTPSYLGVQDDAPTVRPDGVCEVPDTCIYFDNEPRGLLALALDELLRLRKEWSEKAAHAAPGSPEWVSAMRRSTAYKVAANSFFGVVGARVSRIYDASVAESITGIARWLIHNTLDQANKWHIKPVYGDTDSGFLQGADDAKVREFVAYCNGTLYPELTAKQGCTRNAVKLAYEKKFERVVFVCAKRYIGRYAHYKGEPANEKSKPEVKGLEYKRGDIVRIARRLQAEIIDLLMGGAVEIPACGEIPAAKTERRLVCADKPEEFTTLVDQYQKLILEGTMTLDDIKMSKRLTKPIHEYAVRKKKDGEDSTQPPHVRVAKMLEQRGEGVGVGTRIDYVVLDGPNKVMAPACDWSGEFDRFELWESYVWPPAERLLTAAFPAVDWAGYRRVRPRKVRIAAAPAAKAAKGKRGSKTACAEQVGLFSLALK